MKHEWKKQEKELYGPKRKPELRKIPRLPFFIISGQGNPNSEEFGEHIQALYALSYAVRMSYKQDFKPDNYFEYTVYPLEGVWDISDEEKKKQSKTLNKDELVFDIMIRQPDFVDEKFAQFIINFTKEKKDLPLLDKVRFEYIEEGEVIQMLHVGPFEDEPASFAQMEEYCTSIGRERESKVHREIYLSDPRRTAPEKLRTVLRFRLTEL